MTAEQTALVRVLSEHAAELSREWFEEGRSALEDAPISDESLRDDCEAILGPLHEAAAAGTNWHRGQGWEQVRSEVARVSELRLAQGLTPRQMAQFLLSLKAPLFTRLRVACDSEEAYAQEMRLAMNIIDRLGLSALEAYGESREHMIAQQREELLELSVPVIMLWQGVLALPLIGTLDSARAQVVMERLLQRVADTGAGLVILDITGVVTVDTMVAQHLLKTAAAARLMGAECVLSGIRPQIAQTIVQLGIELSDIETRATLADALQYALARVGQVVVAPEPGAEADPPAPTTQPPGPA